MPTALATVGCTGRDRGATITLRSLDAVRNDRLNVRYLGLWTLSKNALRRRSARNSTCGHERIGSWPNLNPALDSARRRFSHLLIQGDFYQNPYQATGLFVRLRYYARKTNEHPAPSGLPFSSDRLSPSRAPVKLVRIGQRAENTGMGLLNETRRRGTITFLHGIPRPVKDGV